MPHSLWQFKKISFPNESLNFNKMRTKTNAFSIYVFLITINVEIVIKNIYMENTFLFVLILKCNHPNPIKKLIRRKRIYITPFK